MSDVVSAPVSSDPIQRALLPESTEIIDGRMFVGGMDVEELANTHGTPLFLFDEHHVRVRLRDYVREFGADNVAYASKAFLCMAMARLADEEGVRIDVASGGEIYVAQAAGVSPARMVFHGNNKSYTELRDAMQAGIGRIVVDSFDELVRIEALVERGLAPPEVLVRVTPGVVADTHEHIRTGHEASKFGFSIASGAALDAVRFVHDSPAVRLVGLHCHIGSQLLELDNHVDAIERVVRFAAFLRREHIIEVAELNIGGGLGIAYVAGHTPPTVDALAHRLRAALDQAVAREGLGYVPKLSVEPGRSIVGSAGITLYRVGTMKNRTDEPTLVAVDGGMSDNIRPAAYGARYEAFVPGRVTEVRPFAAKIVGKHCEDGDVLVHDARLPSDVKVGDVIALPATGAYCFSMSSNYNKLPRPAVVFVAHGRSRTVVRRETLDDLLRFDEI